GFSGSLPPCGGGLFWLLPPLWGRAGVGGLAMADEVPGINGTPASVPVGKITATRSRRRKTVTRRERPPARRARRRDGPGPGRSTRRAGQPAWHGSVPDGRARPRLGR